MLRTSIEYHAKEVRDWTNRRLTINEGGRKSNHVFFGEKVKGIGPIKRQFVKSKIHQRILFSIKYLPVK